ncbi:MAG: DUF3570 domain-containing protein [Gammaproteobacteria bacterium]|nr:DUF3570 domain-containing protein [Gammaproteobacteria bacterium]
MKSIRRNLALATCSLLSQQAGANAFENDWELDTSYLSYQESNERVSVKKFIGDVRGKVSDDDSVSFKLVHDTLSGASPTGAVKSDDQRVTFTGASGGGEIDAGQNDALAAFDDTRLALSMDWQHTMNRHLKTTYGASISSENDYESFGGSLGLEKESANRLVTYQAGLSYTGDTIYRAGSGDTPAPLAQVSDTRSFGKGERNTWEALGGISRVINKRTVGQMNLSYARSEGYHSDPYKLISATDGDGNPVDTFYESRPDQRNRASLYTKLAHELSANRNTVHASYRLYQDDWNIRSHTFDLKYNNKLGGGQFLEPHVRLYRQTAADFYKHHLAVDDNVDVIMPDDGYLSADYRLDRFWSYTAGLKYGLPLGKSGKLRLRAEYMKQTFAHAEYRVNSAVIMQASYSYAF